MRYTTYRSQLDRRPFLQYVQRFLSGRETIIGSQRLYLLWSLATC